MFPFADVLKYAIYNFFRFYAVNVDVYFYFWIYSSFFSLSYKPWFFSTSLSFLSSSSFLLIKGSIFFLNYTKNYPEIFNLLFVKSIGEVNWIQGQVPECCKHAGREKFIEVWTWFFKQFSNIFWAVSGVEIWLVGNVVRNGELNLAFQSFPFLFVHFGNMLDTRPDNLESNFDGNFILVDHDIQGF